MAGDWIAGGYTALVAVGGIIGYVKAGSVMSLSAGLLFGILSGLSAVQLSQNPRNVWLSLGTYGGVLVVMGVRFLSSWKVMPAGLVAGVSLFMFLRSLRFLWLDKKRP
ncbi:transmembrane protein 14Cb [Hoplias malabaricus]|uniref:transmembrane protein 14Cb n=1 Tax=Hoplias malabaricus TaxID=27720 RepID=UPI003463282C